MFYMLCYILIVLSFIWLGPWRKFGCSKFEKAHICTNLLMLAPAKQLGAHMIDGINI